MHRASQPALTRRLLLTTGIAALLARPDLASAQGASPPILLAIKPGEWAVPGTSQTLLAPLINGAAAGPLVNTVAGAETILDISNGTAAALRFSVQGLRSSIAPDEPVPAGQTRTIRFTAPDAGTFVYRFHAEAEENVGETVLLAGPVIVGGNDPAVADRDICAAFSILNLAGEDGSRRRLVLVNGGPALSVSARLGERLRLRLANLAEDVAPLRLPEGARIIALDGQPCAPFPPLDNVLLLPPLGRADILLDMPALPGDVVVKDDLTPDHVLVRIAVAGEPVAARTLADRLPDNPRLPAKIPLKSAVRANLPTGQPAPEVLVNARKGQTVVLTVSGGKVLTALRLEGVSARHLDTMDDGWKPWWLDTQLIFPGETSRLAFVIDSAGRYPVILQPLEGGGPTLRSVVQVD
ncbi:multicopper oxidase domain-containing protein [Terrihabitans rhizophilus]|uniref:multicopper oxidase domain-containing protein n=1 Tax=Terrihabitans rhizophilus TaxID=3092662 RepID=UPI0029DE905B|nr:multicopper oxidase domain-containing protein [Terrihabitans sp. PJ23]